jgi:hypothetical protein
VVHTKTDALCTVAVAQVGAFATHYQSLFVPGKSPLNQKLCTVNAVPPRCTASANRPNPTIQRKVHLSLEENHQALSRMANHKAPEADGVPTELLKYCGPQGREPLLILCSLVHDRDCIPHGWREGILQLMPKPGDLTNRPDYPGLTLLPTITKIFTHLLLPRVRPHDQLNDHQCGFRCGRSTADARFALDATVRPRMQRGEQNACSSSTGLRSMTVRCTMTFLTDLQTRFE